MAIWREATARREAKAAENLAKRAVEAAKDKEKHAELRDAARLAADDLNKLINAGDADSSTPMVKLMKLKQRQLHALYFISLNEPVKTKDKSPPACAQQLLTLLMGGKLPGVNKVSW